MSQLSDCTVSHRPARKLAQLEYDLNASLVAAHTGAGVSLAVDILAAAWASFDALPEPLPESLVDDLVSDDLVSAAEAPTRRSAATATVRVRRAILVCWFGAIGAWQGMRMCGGVCWWAATDAS